MISSERQSALVGAIVKDLLKKKIVPASSREDLFQSVRQGFSRFLEEWQHIHEEVRGKIESIKRGVLSGSAEWDVLYFRFFEEKYKQTSSLLLKERSPSKTFKKR